MTIRCVAFDFDDTLVLSERVKRETFWEVIDASLHRHLEAALAVRPQLDRHETFAHVAAQAGLGASRAGEWARAYTDLVDERIAQCPDVDGATEALVTLRCRGVRVVIVSDTPEEALRRAVARRVWADQVHEVLGRPVSKPDHLRRVARAGAFSTGEMVMVGDRDSDRHAAAEVGAAFIRVTHGDDDGDRAAVGGPTAGSALSVVGSLAGVPDIVVRLDDR